MSPITTVTSLLTDAYGLLRLFFTPILDYQFGGIYSTLGNKILLLNLKYTRLFLTHLNTLKLTNLFISAIIETSVYISLYYLIFLHFY